MKMLKNGREVDESVTSHTPIPSPPCMKRVDVPRCAARPPEPPAQVHPDHHVEDGAVAEPVDGVEPVDEVVVYKNRDLSFTVPKCVVVVDTRWLLGANAPRPDADHVDVASRVGRHRSWWMSKKASSC